MGYFEDLGFIPNNAPLVEKITILSLIRPRLVYGLQLGAIHHKIGNKTVKIVDALAALNVEMNRLISRVSFKQFKNYVFNLHNQQGLSAVNRNFWRTYPQLRKYLNDLDQEEEIEIKHRLEKRLRHAKHSPEVRIYIDYETAVKSNINLINSGQIPLEFLNDPLQAYLEQAVIQNQGSFELWLSISQENIQRNQIEDAIYAAEEAYWAADVTNRLEVINFMKEKFSSIEPTSPLLDYYSYALKWYQDDRYGRRSEPLPDDELSHKFDPYHKLAYMFLAMAPEGYAADPLVKLPPPFRLKSTILLSIIFNNSYEDLVVLARKLEDTLQQVLIWGVKDSDLSPQIRQTISNYYALQEHDSGILQSVKQLDSLYNCLKPYRSRSSTIIIFDLIRSLLHFNHKEEANEIFQNLPTPNLNEIVVTEQQESTKQNLNLEDRYSTKFTYLINYALLKLRLDGDPTSLDQVLDRLLNEISQLSDMQISQITQYRVIFTQTLIILLDHIEQMNIEVYIDKIFATAEKANIELQFLFAIAPTFDSNLMYRVNKHLVIKNRYLKFAQKLLQKQRKELIELCITKGLYLYLNILVGVVVSMNDGTADFKDMANILIEQIQNPLRGQQETSATSARTQIFAKGDIISNSSYNSWLTIFRDVKNYNEILVDLVDKAKTQRRDNAAFYLELCLIQLLAEKKHPTASENYLIMGERLWNYSGDDDTKEKLLWIYINIAPYFGLVNGSLYLKQALEHLDNLISSPTASSNLISEIGLAIGNATSKLEKDMSITLNTIDELLTTNESILNSQDMSSENPTRKAPFVLFQGLSQTLANVSKLSLPPNNLMEIYTRVSRLVETFLNSPYMQKPINATSHLAFPLRTLFWCSIGLSNLDLGQAEGLLDMIFTKVSTLNDGQYKFVIPYFLEILQEDSGPLRSEILERITKETIRRVQLSKTQARTSGLPEYLYEILSLLIRVISNSDSKVVSEFRKLRGDEENTIVTEIYSIMKSKDILY